MATREQQAQRVDQVYYWLLLQAGFQQLEESFSLFDEVPATQRASQGARWLRIAVRAIILRRRLLRDLALAYYRLVRALRTGRTIRDPRRDEGGAVSLEVLRQQFEEIADLIVPEEIPEQVPDELEENLEEPPSLVEDDDDQILLDEIAELEAEIERMEREAEEEAEELLRTLGLENLDKKLDEIDDELPANEVDELRSQAHRKAASRQAAEAERISLNAARGLTYSIAGYDDLLIGWARYSQTGTPCAWCAMLISRGFVYKSAKSGGGDGTEDLDKFHANCHCVAVPVFSLEQFKDSELFNLNRELRQIWNEARRLHGGALSLEQWRRYWRLRTRNLAVQAAA